MAINKCLKCGADIPEGAGFCPSCGAPKGAQAAVQASQQGQPQMKQTPSSQQPMPAPMKPPKTSMGLGPTVESLLTTTFVSIFVLIGILLAFIGKIVAQWSGTATYYLTVLGLNGAGAALLFGGFFNKNMNPNMRAGMITAGGIMITVANIPIVAVV